MKLEKRIVTLAVAAACAAPLAAAAQTSSRQAAAAPPELVVITITPVEQRVMNEQRRESLFRALDANSDGQVSMAEAGVNTQLVDAFQKLDRNSNRSIDRQEFARVHVDEGKASSTAQAERSPRQSSSASGGATSEPDARVPSPRIDERAIGVQPNLPPQPVR